MKIKYALLMLLVLVGSRVNIKAQVQTVGPFDASVSGAFKSFKSGRTWSCIVGEDMVVLSQDDLKKERFMIRDFSKSDLSLRNEAEFKVEDRSNVVWFGEFDNRALVLVAHMEIKDWSTTLKARFYDPLKGLLETSERVILDRAGTGVPYRGDIKSQWSDPELWPFLFHTVSDRTERNAGNFLDHDVDTLSLLEPVVRDNGIHLERKWTIDLNTDPVIYGAHPEVSGEGGELYLINEPKESCRKWVEYAPSRFGVMGAKRFIEGEPLPIHERELKVLSAQGELLASHPLDQRTSPTSSFHTFMDANDRVHIIAVLEDKSRHNVLYSAVLESVHGPLTENFVPIDLTDERVVGKDEDDRTQLSVDLVDQFFCKNGSVLFYQEKTKEDYETFSQVQRMLMVKVDNNGQVAWMKRAERRSYNNEQMLFRKDERCVVLQNTAAPEKGPNANLDINNVVYQPMELELSSGEVFLQQTFTARQIFAKSADQTLSWNNVIWLAPDEAAIEMPCKGNESRWLRLKLR